jgi:protease II
MRKQYIYTLLLFFVSVILITDTPVLAQMDGASTTPQPPMAEKKPKETKIHGDTLVDDYFWLREKSNPAVLEHLKAEDAYALAMMKPTEGLQAKLYKEMLSHIKQTDQNVPYRLGGYFYYTRTEEGKQYPIFCRKQGSLDAKEEVVLDQNELAKGQKFMSVGAFAPSDDGNLLAYSTDNTGYRQYTLQMTASSGLPTTRRFFSSPKTPLLNVPTSSFATRWAPRRTICFTRRRTSCSISARSGRATKQ